MKRLKVQFYNLEQMVGFIKEHKLLMHEYDKSSDLLELCTDQDLEDRILHHRGRVLSVEYINFPTSYFSYSG